MGKVVLGDDSCKDMRNKSNLKCKNGKYLKPGLLAQYRSCKALMAKPYVELAVLNGGMVECGLQRDLIVESPTEASFPIVENVYASQSNVLMKTPTAVVDIGSSESMLESLPMDLLVKIVCHLHHDDLKPAFHVSQRLRKAVMLARQHHFNYKTPVRTRQELMRVHTPISSEYWPIQSKGSLNFVWVSSPHTPKAPKRDPRPLSQLKYTHMRQIAAVLFPEKSISSRYKVPSVLQRTPCKAVASHRALFYEDELCHAVAQNKLR